MRWYHWLAAIVLGVASFLEGGCGFVASDLKIAGQYPGYMEWDCGDGANLSVQGNLAALMYGSNNAAGIQCKGHLIIRQGTLLPPTVTAVPASATPGVERFGNQAIR